MTIKKTCLVFGAGVSRGYGFPLGRGLMIQLCKQLAGGADIATALATVDFSPAEIDGFRDALVASHAESVDRFVANRPEFEKIGKFAIAAALIPHETLNNLVPEADPRIYEYIWHRIGRDLETLKENRLSIVTFNYDRSLEYFLLNAIKAQFGLPDDQCDLLLATQIRIAHVYGDLGPAGLAQNNRLPYSPVVNAAALHNAVRGIHLVRDGNIITPSIRAAQDLIREADHTCLLGFGFDSWNVRRLGLSHRTTLVPVFATALGLTAGERAAVSRQFDSLGGIHLAQPHVDAFGLLREQVDILT